CIRLLFCLFVLLHHSLVGYTETSPLAIYTLSLHDALPILVPMSAELPDIEVGHVATPTQASALGAKGAGEAGVTGAPAAILNAINDALAPFGAAVDRLPATPLAILQAFAHAAQ